MEGYVKIYRSLKNKGYYTDSEYVHLWIELLFLAQYGEREFLFNGKIQKLSKGQLITSRQKLSINTGIQESKIERILNCFKTEHQIEQQTNSKFRLITILNWERYQNNEQQIEQPVNSERTASEHIQEDIINNKKDNNSTESPKNLMKEFSEKVSNQDQEYIESFISSVSEKMKLDKELVKKEVQKFWLYWTESNGKKTRWEMEKTFELDRRLLTWLSNVNKFSPKLDKKKDNWVTF